MDSTILSISVGSLAMSCLALGWNIYREILLRPRLRVRMSLGCLAHMKGSPSPMLFTNEQDLAGPDEATVGQQFIVISVVNLGPGSVEVHSIPAIGQRKGNFSLVPDMKDLTFSRLPAKLTHGETANFKVAPTEATFLLDSVRRLGLRDQYGRMHWVPKRNFRKLKRTLVTHQDLLMKQEGDHD